MWRFLELKTKCECVECECMSKGEPDSDGKYICDFCKMGNHENKY